MTEDDFDKLAEEYFKPEHHNFNTDSTEGIDEVADDFTEE